MKISPQIVQELIGYDPLSGALTWKHRDRSRFANDRACSTWNARYAGLPALQSPHSKGYLHGCIFKQMVLAHRAAFAVAHGRWPSEIDHINGDKTDNRLANLREVTRAGNMRNLPRRKNSRSIIGVSPSSSGKSWVARIGNGIFLGTFATPEEAAAARQKALQERGYHPNHGRSTAQQEASNG